MCVRACTHARACPTHAHACARRTRAQALQTQHVSVAPAADPAAIATTPDPRFSPATQVAASTHLAIVRLRNSCVRCLLAAHTAAAHIKGAASARELRMREGKISCARGCRTRAPWALPSNILTYHMATHCAPVHGVSVQHRCWSVRGAVESMRTLCTSCSRSGRAASSGRMESCSHPACAATAEFMLASAGTGRCSSAAPTAVVRPCEGF